MKIYVTISNNGYSYEDYSDWVSYVGTNLNLAISSGKKGLIFMSKEFDIQCWEKNKLLHTYTYKKSDNQLVVNFIENKEE